MEITIKAADGTIVTLPLAELLAAAQTKSGTPSTKYNRDYALALLRLATGDSEAEFREGQEEAIRYLVEQEGRGRILLVVQKTGWGKSLVYFIVTALLRKYDNSYGPTILFSPLLSLMRNQVEAAERMELVARKITSENPNEWSEVEQCVKDNEVDVLLISPERLDNEEFKNNVLPYLTYPALIVVDEAHCISDWGHDFRPLYKLIGRYVAIIPKVRLLCTTATANDRVEKNICKQLGDLAVCRGPLARHSLKLQTMRLANKSERLAWLVGQAPRYTETQANGIIYVLTVRDAHQVARWLREHNFKAEAYTGQMETEERERREQALLNNEVSALVATSALGMGFDKPDLDFVIHYQCPPVGDRLLSTGWTCWKAKRNEGLWCIAKRPGRQRYPRLFYQKCFPDS